MFEFVVNFQFTGLMGILLYWIPALICCVGYTLRTAVNIAKDKKDRAKAEKSNSFYYPTDTIGTLIGRAVVTIIPIANIWAALFDVSPKLFSKFFRFVDKVFDQPLVPARKD